MVDRRLRALLEADPAGMVGGMEVGAAAAEDAGKRISDTFDKSTSKVGGLFSRLGQTLQNWGLPFGNTLTNLGKKFDEAESKGSKFGDVMSAVGKISLVVGAAGIIGVAAASFKLATSLQSAESQLAATANISVSAAKQIGDAFLSTGGSTIFTAQQMVESYSGVSAQLATLQGHALSSSQALKFMKVATDEAEASGESLSTATSTLGGVMQTFQIPLSKASKAADELFSTSRLTGVSLGQLGSTVERLKARLGVATPSLGDLDSLLVDLSEHGVKGSRGLLLINSAVNTLLDSTQTLSTAQAKAADTYASKLQSAQDAVEEAQQAVTTAQQKTGESAAQVAASTAASSAETAQSQIANAQSVANANQAAALATEKAETALAQKQQILTETGNQSLQGQIDLQNLQATVTQDKAHQAQLLQEQAQKAQLTSASLAAKTAASSVTASNDQVNATDSVSSAQLKLQIAQQNLYEVTAAGTTTTNANIATLEQLGLQVYNAHGRFIGMRDIIAELQPKLKAMSEEQQINTLRAVFGKNANKALLDVVLAGPAAYDKARAAVERANAAHEAAAKQLQTFQHMVDLVKTQVIDWADRLGQWLIPKVTGLMHAVAEATGWLEKHKAVALAVAAVIGGILLASIVKFTVETAGRALKASKDFANSLLHLRGTFRSAAGGADEASAAETAQAEKVAALQEKVDLLSAKLRLQRQVLGEEAEAETQATETSLSQTKAQLKQAQATEKSSSALRELSELSGQADERLAALQEQIDGVTAASDGMAEGLPAADAGLDVTTASTDAASEGFLGLGSAIASSGVGVLLIALGLAAQQLMQHWRGLLTGAEIAWHGIERAGLAAWHILDNDVIHPFMHGLDVALSFVEKWGPRVAALMLLPVLPIVGLTLVVVKFHSQIAHLLGLVGDAFERVPKVVLHAFASAGHWLLEAGEHILEGLLHGIENGIGKIGSVMDKVGHAILHSVTSFFGIFSPSRRFQEIGANLMEGLALGIDDRSSAAHAALTRAVTPLTAPIRIPTNLPAQVLTAGGVAGTPGVTGPYAPGAAGAGAIPGASTHQENTFNISGSDPHQVATEVIWAMKTSRV